MRLLQLCCSCCSSVAAIAPEVRLKVSLKCDFISPDFISPDIRAIQVGVDHAVFGEVSQYIWVMGECAVLRYVH